MSIDAMILTRLAALDMPAETHLAVLSILADSHKPSDRKEANRRAYEKRKAASATESATELSTESATENILKPTENQPSHIRACVLYGLESKSLKELPTVVRKDQPPSVEIAIEASEPIASPITPSDLFGTASISDIRHAKRAADKRTIVFVGEGWNALALEFPRIATVGVIPDGSARERAILARSRDLLKDFDFDDAEAGWKTFFGKIRASPFLRGDAPPSGARDRPFKPRLDAIIAPQMFLKIMEDQYLDEVQIRRKVHANGYAAHR